MNKDNAIEKVRKLMRLAEKSGTEEEGLAAAAMAQKIMTRYQLDSSDLLEIDENAPLNVHEPRTIYGPALRTPTWVKELASGLGRLCGCYVWSKHVSFSEGWSLVAAGRPRDLDAFAVLFECVRSTAIQIWNKHPERKGLRRASYLRGLIEGFVGRMTQASNATCDLLRASSREAIVPFDRARAAEQEVYSKLDLESAPRLPKPDQRSLVAGYRKGSSMRVPGEHEALTGQRAIGGAS